MATIIASDDTGEWIKRVDDECCPLSLDQKFEALWDDGSVYGPADAWEWDFIMSEGDGDPVPVAYRVLKAESQT